jgi:hypothetical protein
MLSGLNFQDLTGKRFGKLVVLRRSETKSRRTFWLCNCDCGKTKIVNAEQLKNGGTKSCGCLLKEPHRKTHGLSNSRLYRIYYAMRWRCYNIKSNSYKDYGARGIKVCDEWLNSFQAFYDWAMANGYQDSLSIDRIDSNGIYEPNNCRWATNEEQSRNKRSNIIFEHNGENRTLAEWCRTYGINTVTAQDRYHSGKTFEEIFNIKN